jgi:predicted SAM-dependent methyltransferase
LNTDLEPASGQAYLDATRRFPLPDRSFQYVFSEHVIEHLSYEDGMTMLKESYRGLAPGGRVRIATPDLLRFVALFQPSKSEEARHYMDEKLKVHGWPRNSVPESVILNLQLRSFGHQFVYDPATLRDRLAQAGFQQIAEFAAGRSEAPELRGLEARARTGFRNINDYETMVFEAVRP